MLFGKKSALASKKKKKCSKLQNHKKTSPLELVFCYLNLVRADQISKLLRSDLDSLIIDEKLDIFKF